MAKPAYSLVYAILIIVGVLAVVEHGHRARMIEARGGQGLVAETRHGAWIAGQDLVQELDGDRPRRIDLVGAIDDAHPTRTQLVVEDVLPGDDDTRIICRARRGHRGGSRARGVPAPIGARRRHHDTSSARIRTMGGRASTVTC